METPLIEALRAKYQALQADFGVKAAERLREVVDHALEQITEGARTRDHKPASTKAGTTRTRSWSPAQRAEQKRKMQAYWAAKRKAEGSKAK